MTTEIVLLRDYRDHFYSATRYKGASMDLDSISSYFAEQGYHISLKQFKEIDFRNQNYLDKYILYQSSEDRDLFYKSYIEDILLGLQLQGAVLIPNFYYFRAHHNKVFMEILRDISELDELKSIVSKGYGTYEEYLDGFSAWPGEIVMKPASGAMSKGVRLLTDNHSKKRYASRLSNSFHLIDAIKYLLKPSFLNNYTKESIHRRKFIVQNFIPDNKNDFKVLVYGSKYYLLKRRNRENDFRASGSGLFEWVEEPPDGLLDFAERVFNSFDCPYLSLDLAYVNNRFHLFEFQFLMFGNLTLENSRFCFSRNALGWQKIVEQPVLEREFVRSVVEHIQRPGKAT